MAKQKKAQTNKPKRVILLDSYAILHRAYHALPDFSSTKGEPTGALYGLSTMLLSIIKELNPDYIVACYDMPEKTYRHEAFDGYKAGRKETDKDLSMQIERAKDVLEAFNIPIYEAPGFEADDVIGTIVEQLKNKKDIDVVIASGDMDTMQLISGKKVQVYTLRKGIKDTVMYDEKAVRERYGFGPELIADYKGLRGDPSDNIPGIAGIGEKSATEVLTAFGSLEDIYKKLKKDESTFEKKGIKARVVKLLKEGEEDAEFSKMLATIRRDAPIVYEIPTQSWREGLEVEKIITLFTELGFRTLKARVHQTFGTEDVFEQQAIAGLEKQEEENVDETQLKETAVALWLLKSNLTNPTLADILDYSGEKEFKKARANIFADLKDKELETIFETLEKPLIPIVDKMNTQGVVLDVKALDKLSKKYHKELDALEQKIYKEAGEEFNIKSPKQLGEILFEKMDLKPLGRIKKTGTGQYSTRESELEKMKDLHPIILAVLEYREFQKLLSTYIDNLPAQVGKDGRLHTEFIQTGTTTGRIASHNPNLQNIPIKTELGRHIRDAFVAEKGYVLAAFDHSQIELRIAAILSEDEKLIETFKKGEDIHSRVACEIFDVGPEEVTKKMRSAAKVINFGILYGMGVNALRANLGTDRSEAQEYLSSYFNKFPGLNSYIEETKRSARKNGYTETLFGRRRYFEGIDSKLPFIRAQAERMAVNAPVQGTSADFIKLAMIRTNELIEKEKYGDDVRLILQVHDELIYEIKENRVNEVVPKIKKIMENVAEGKETKGVPIVAGASTGPDWGHLTDF